VDRTISAWKLVVEVWEERVWEERVWEEGEVDPNNEYTRK
jgi:hypothetical protein